MARLILNTTLVAALASASLPVPVSAADLASPSNVAGPILSSAHTQLALQLKSRAQEQERQQTPSQSYLKSRKGKVTLAVGIAVAAIVIGSAIATGPDARQWP